jgi:hypothetical protein
VLATNPTLALANAVLFLEAFGHTVIAWIWLRQALAAQRGLAAGNRRRCRLLSWQTGGLPLVLSLGAAQVRQWHELLRSLDDTTLTMAPASF